MAGARRRRCAGMGSWGPRVQRKVVSGAARRGRKLGGNDVDGEALQLRGGGVSARNSGELRGDGSLLHANSKEKRLEMRSDMGNGVERSRGRECDGVDRKPRNSVAERGGSGEQSGQPGGVVFVFEWGK